MGTQLVERYVPRLRAVAGGVAHLVVLLRDESIVEVADGFAAVIGSQSVVHVLGAGRSLAPGEQSALGPTVRYVHAPTLRARLDYLMRMPRPQVIIDAGARRRQQKASSFRELFYFVAPGGFYAIEDLDATGDPDIDDGGRETVLGLVTQVAAARYQSPKSPTKAKAPIRELAAHTGRVEFAGNAVVLERTGGRLFVKLRDRESDDVLTTRYDDAWGSTVLQLPATQFVSRCEVVNHGEGPIAEGRRTFSVPDRLLRCYRGVTCTARQIVRFGDYILPDSWRHPNQPKLNNRQLVFKSPYFSSYHARTRPLSSRSLPGSFYYLDTELPGHFGHITTEVLSRVWAFRAAHEADPGIRLLVSVATLPRAIPGFQQDIFRSLGLPVDDAEIMAPQEDVVVERLYAPTPQLENPYYVDPALGEVWAELAAHLPAGRPATADKIFVSRRAAPKRHCHQTPEIEAFFAREGFSIIFPEDHSYRDQKMIFSRAKVIAGFGGSGMFNAMFAPKARLILLSGDAYNAENEHLIAAVNGNDLHYFWGRSEVPMPEHRFSLKAFTSPWSFDLRRYRRALRRLVR